MLSIRVIIITQLKSPKKNGQKIGYFGFSPGRGSWLRGPAVSAASRPGFALRSAEQRGSQLEERVSHCQPGAAAAPSRWRLSLGDRELQHTFRTVPRQTHLRFVNRPIPLIQTRQEVKPELTFCGHPQRNPLSGAYEEIIIFIFYMHHSKIFQRPTAQPRGAPKVKSVVLRCLWLSFHVKDLQKANPLA